jgi:uridine phosphorylase
MKDENEKMPPLLSTKAYEEPSVFLPEYLLREARRQLSIPDGHVPPVCVLDPDGDILRSLLSRNEAKEHPHWACYHTKLYEFSLDGMTLGIIGFTVGASFAVLVAEELFASGCRLLMNVTSSGQIVEKEAPPFFLLVDKSLRDEGASYHYLPPSDFAHLDERLLKLFEGAFKDSAVPVYRGSTWTTDAPFRETERAIEKARRLGIRAVEMESAALYAFAKARLKPVVCFAHVTNRMGSVEGDFEKGEASGSQAALQLIAVAAKAWLSHHET